MEEIIHRAQDILAQLRNGYSVEQIRSHYTDEEQIQFVIKVFEGYVESVLEYDSTNELFIQLKEAAIKAGFKIS